MKKTFNFILNQLGAVVLLVAGLLLYLDYVDFTIVFAIVVVGVLAIVFVASQLTYKNLQRDIAKLTN